MTLFLNIDFHHYQPVHCVCVCACVHVCVSACVCVCMCVCAHVRVYILHIVMLEPFVDMCIMCQLLLNLWITFFISVSVMCVIIHLFSAFDPWGRRFTNFHHYHYYHVDVSDLGRLT